MCSLVQAAGIPSLFTIFHQDIVVISFVTDLHKIIVTYPSLL